MGLQTLSVTTQCEGIWYSFLEVIVTTAAESPTYRHPVCNNFYNNFSLFLQNPYDLPRPDRYTLLHFFREKRNEKRGGCIMPLLIRGRRGRSRMRGPPMLPRRQRRVNEESGVFCLGGKVMRRKMGFLERVVLVLVVTIAAVGIATQALADISALTIDRQADLLMDGTVVHVTGLAQGTGGEAAGLSVSIVQSQGRLLNTGTGFTTFDCDGTVQAWEVLVSAVAGSYQNGPATAIVSMSSSGEDDTDFRTA